MKSAQELALEFGIELAHTVRELHAERLYAGQLIDCGHALQTKVQKVGAQRVLAYFKSREFPASDKVDAYGEFAAKNLGKEIAVAASGFKEARVDALGLFFHEVEHGIDFTRIGEHLAMVLHPSAGLDLARCLIGV